MNAPATLVAFVVALLGVFGAAVLVGGAVGPEPRSAEPSPEDGGQARARHEVRGLAVAEDGLRLASPRPSCAAAASEPLRFRIVDARRRGRARLRRRAHGACT